MTILEHDFIDTMLNNSAEIAKQLKIANELKALELKFKYPEAIAMIDSIENQI